MRSIDFGRGAMARSVMLLGVVSAACAPLPDIKPFADASAHMAAGLDRGFAEVEQVHRGLARELRERVIHAHPDVRSGYEAKGREYAEAADAFAANRRARAAIAGALVTYADSLAAIADASKGASDTAEAVASSVQSLLSVVGANPLPGMALDLVKLGARTAIEVRAASAMRTAVANADPIVQEVVGVLRADIATLRDVALRTKPEAVRAAIEGPRDDDLNLRRALLAERRIVAERVRTLLGEEPDRRTEDPITGAAAERLREIDEAIARTDSWYLPMVEDVRRAQDRVRTAHEVVERAGVLIDEWGRAHAELGAALAGNRRPSVRRLVELGLELKRILDAPKEGT